MMKKEQRLEFRQYDIPKGDYVLPLLGADWELAYGSEHGKLMRFHNYMEIGFCHRGHGTLWIEDRCYQYGDRTLAIIPENIPHTILSRPGERCRWEFMFVDIKGFVHNEFHSDEIPVEEVIRILGRRGTMKSEKNHPVIAHLILQILDECRRKQPYYEESIKGYLYSLIIEVLRLDEEREQIKRKNRLTTYVRNAISFVEQHYAEEIGVMDMAAECGLSESHLRRVFQENMNMKPVEYINKVRIDAACELIRKEPLSLEEIGCRVGYTTPSTFNRNFRKLTGMTPNQWRKLKA